jgi:DNA-binding response OmpR family regulator
LERATTARRSPAPMSTQQLPRGRILLVDDDVTVAEIVARYLARDGYEVESVTDGAVALQRAQAEPPDLVLLDLMLPGMSGLDVCRRLRASTAIPIIMLTARGEESDRVFGLNLGADDYVVKPFSPREVIARVESVLRRAAPGANAEVSRGNLALGEIEVDLAARIARRAGETVVLTAREFDLLAFLIQHPNRVFTREELMEHVWGHHFGDTATVTVHIRRLRSKFEADPSRPVRFETVWGVGYRFRR